MNVLAFDTCFGACSVAMIENLGARNAQVHTYFKRCEAGHAELLLPLVKTALAQARLPLSAIDRLAITIGPGTFTGARIGVAAARAFALVAELPVAIATSLAVIADEAADTIADWPEADLLVAMDARRDAVYAQLFERNGRESKSPPLVLPIAEAARLILAPCLVVGSAAEPVAALARQRGVTAMARLSDLLPTAANLAFMAPRLPHGPGAFVRPLYLREADAKPQAAPRAIR